MDLGVKDEFVEGKCKVMALKGEDPFFAKKNLNYYHRADSAWRISLSSGTPRWTRSTWTPPTPSQSKTSLPSKMS